MLQYARGYNKPDFSNKVVIVTGASTGIGRATAIAFRQARARVALAARSADVLADLAVELGGPQTALPLPADIGDPEQCRQLIESAVAHFGQIDVLVNNAGMLVAGRVEYLQPGDMERQFAVNYFGAYHCTQAALPYLKQSRGVVVNISSVASFLGVPTSGAYAASKAALNSLGQTLWVELRPYGIGVSTVCPYFTSGAQLGAKGILRQGNWQDAKDRRKAPGIQTCEQVAAAILEAAHRRPRLMVLSPAGRFIWRLNRLAPWLPDLIMAKVIK
ncbi:MAG: SDR family oxidoreductase [Caldilineales bacterium]|nr:SDR family oxidoreductase [Caldilineales bacterium]